MNGFKYQVEGALSPEAPSYLERKADQDLYQKLKTGCFCYILNSEKSGKSSLKLRIKTRLEQEGVCCGIINLEKIGKVNSEIKFYKNIFYELLKEFQLEHTIDLENWFNKQSFSSPSTMNFFTLFVDEILLTEIRQNIVIFFDQIECLLSIKSFNYEFSIDNFFASILFCYKERETRQNYKRLNFAVLGVATCNDLVKNLKYNIFNQGHSIELSGFELKEVYLLEEGLRYQVGNPQKVLVELIKWTNGQPFLLQKLCYIIANSDIKIPNGEEVETVEKLVNDHLIKNWEFNEDIPYLRAINNRLKHESNSQDILKLYEKIVQRGEIPINNTEEESRLLLLGIVIKKNGKLIIYNPIHREVFNQNWINKKFEDLGIETSQDLQSDQDISNQSTEYQTEKEEDKGKNVSLLLLSRGCLPIAFLLLLFILSLFVPRLTRKTSEVCIGRDLTLTLEEQIKQLETLENKQQDDFSQECQNQLKELKLLWAAIQEGTKNRVVPNSMERLCQIPENSIYIEEAKLWLRRWYQDEYWGDLVRQYLKENSSCPVAKDLNDD